MATLLAPDNGGPKDGTGDAHRLVNLVPGLIFGDRRRQQRDRHRAC
jgi:hypothetical protein